MHAIILQRAIAVAVARRLVAACRPEARHRPVRPQRRGHRDVHELHAQRAREPARLCDAVDVGGKCWVSVGWLMMTGAEKYGYGVVCLLWGCAQRGSGLAAGFRLYSGCSTGETRADRASTARSVVAPYA